MRPILWSGAKSVGRETLRAGGDILADMAERSQDERPRDIVKRRVNEATQNLLGKFQRGRRRRKLAATAAAAVKPADTRNRKRTAAAAGPRQPRKSAKRTYRDNVA